MYSIMTMHIANATDYYYYYYFLWCSKGSGKNGLGKHSDDCGGPPFKQGCGSEWRGTVRGYRHLMCQIKRNGSQLTKR